VEFCLHAPRCFSGARLYGKEQIFCYCTRAFTSIKRQEFWRKTKVSQQLNISYTVKINFKIPLFIQGDQKVSVHLMITPLSQHTSFLPHYLAQSDCFAADRQGQGNTRLTLTPSVIPNSNYVIMVSD
jgi:hypothetical protein